MHAQLPAGSAGVATPGAREAAVPSGLYAVTVAVGDIVEDLPSSSVVSGPWSCFLTTGPVS
ncbi:hypothetical protein Aab01nite_01210 [Paractinoplanes abujensis]|uniref:Uncharacterized protein n=2 Tax=Paractinoplanes abujensis TaxID=882441 RepID=A0A7W7CNZ5_9ACTN|nr:hypothetical protein [Actinoplanes abujensis]MBB4692052.1 hypothetical protein [Actinoplanes abujensis]GID16531.1 hypothetical protein Aab01nite_01210 [Actinoplanes abujensis]